MSAEIMIPRRQVERLTRERDELQKQNALWQQNSIDTREAMVAMRNDINEHVPLPSMEGDLLQGPESSVFCAAVTQAVVGRIRELEEQVAFTLSDTSRMIRKGDVIGVCPDPESCFYFGDRVRCGPCAVKASAAKGIAIDDTHSHLPEVCRLRRQVRELEARLAAALENAAAVAEAANVYELPSHAHIVGAAIRRLNEGLKKTGEGCGEYGCGPDRIMDVVSAIMSADEAADIDAALKSEGK